MKKTSLFLLLMLPFLFLFTSCEKVDTPVASLKAFTRDADGKPEKVVIEGGTIEIDYGTTLYFSFTGSGRYASLWTGDLSISTGFNHDYEAYLASGKNPAYQGVSLSASTADHDFSYTYEYPGTYKVYLLATNSWANGEETSRKETYLTVTVKDPGHKYLEFLGFSVRRLGSHMPTTLELQGEFDGEKIQVESPGTANLSGTIVVFTVNPGVKVFIGDSLQASGITRVNMDEPVVYRLEGPQGNAREISVSITRLPVEAGALITSYSVPELNITGTIDQEEKTITLLFPYGTGMQTGTFKPVFDRSYLSLVRVGNQPQNSGVTQRSFASSFTYRVTAEDVSIENIYTVKAIEGIGIVSAKLSGLIPQVNAVVKTVDRSLSFKVLEGTSTSALELDIVTSPAEVDMIIVNENGVEVNRSFTSGETKVNFAKPVTLKLSADGVPDVIYTIEVNKL